eukprot:COSAG01_NODE_64610_length_276_cov_0.559322_1_plen_91_part_11
MAHWLPGTPSCLLPGDEDGAEGTEATDASAEAAGGTKRKDVPGTNANSCDAPNKKPKEPRPKKRRAFRSGSGEPIVKEENLIIWFRYIAER